MKALDLKHIFHKELDLIYGKNEVESFFFLATEHYFSLARIQLALDQQFSFSKPETNTLFTILEDLKQQKPIQYILGYTEFYGLKFKVNPNVLIPRPETEELVDWIINSYKEFSHSAIKSSHLKILDIGTGSGCIAISLAKHLLNAKVYAIDVSKAALEVAKENAKINQVEVEFLELDILKYEDASLWEDVVELKKGFFDIIVSNPPYVRHLEKKEMQPNVLDNEPHLALFVADNDPLVFYKAITDFAVDNLKQKGQLYFEINQYLGEDSIQLLNNESFEAITLKKDLSGNDRMLKGIKK
ncbi:peptide chain release factor N(5)-glutamine methyltransferase [uncultured Winogradskyella sp.]|uniref:peptide chain release factor N(5)-glutamine methyltransferase n=1 Tax=uncultured Winogradskyella sp. TaxID=395353 RepID=UPI00261127EB|nr:peptide chain release factor N(5)-glutamine methyltransferase [uncultured Winogradskyella sp.]